MTVNTITKVLMVNGSKDYVMQFSIVGQATTDENGTLVNVTSGDCGSAFSQLPGTVQQITTPLTGACRILAVQGDLTGFSAQLLFEDQGDSAKFALQLPSGHPFNYKFDKVGGILNKAVNPTGNILITTVGITTAASGSFVLRLRKK